jgi:hypothetical protein
MRRGTQAQPKAPDRGLARRCRGLGQTAAALPDRHFPLGSTSAWIARRRFRSSSTKTSFSALAPLSALSRNSLASVSPGVRGGAVGERVAGTSLVPLVTQQTMR